MINKKQIEELKYSFDNKGYCIVPNCIHSHLENFLKIYFSFPQKSTEEFDEAINVVNKPPTKIYSSIIGESLLSFYTPLYNLISNKKLIPSYSYFRTYHKNNNLKSHIDRSSCQYSATILLNSDQNKLWPFYLEDKNQNNIEIFASPFDLVLYKGEEVYHWREELQHEYSSHLFLHWVDGNDPSYKKFWFDGRKKLGIPR